MQKTIYFFLVFLTLGIFLGFSNRDNPNGLAKTNFVNKIKSAPTAIDNNNNNSISTALDLFSDDFTAPNDTAALKARGYLVYRNGTFSGTPPPDFWTSGNPGPFIFPAFNGGANDYVSASFRSAGDLGDIDNWLVLPVLDIVALDSICFYSRSTDAPPFYADSIRVMFNPLGGTLPSSPGWIELGRFEVNIIGVWEFRSFVIPISALSARLAIRYSVVNGGLFGANSHYIGIDALRVHGDRPLPVELTSFVSVITNNNVTLNWTTAIETNNSGFDIERLSTAGGINGQWSKIGNVKGNGTTTSSENFSFVDRGLNSGKYNYRLKQIDFNGNFEYFNLSNDVVIGIPSRFKLSQNYPNPFNPVTVIRYSLIENRFITLKIYDINGKEVATLVNQIQNAGYYAVDFDANYFSSGVYFYKLAVDGNIIDTKRMMLLK